MVRRFVTFPCVRVCGSPVLCGSEFSPSPPPPHTLSGRAQESHRIRITLSSQNVVALEAVCAELKRSAENNSLKGKVKGPVRLPTKTLRITTRKTPCGEGSKTWDRYEMVRFSAVAFALQRCKLLCFPTAPPQNHSLPAPLLPPAPPFAQRIHKRIIDLNAPAESVKAITTIDIQSGVEVEVRVLSQ